MWNTFVATADSVAGRLVLGFLNVTSDHPFIFVGVAAVLLCLTMSVFVDLIGLRGEMMRTVSESASDRVIKLRR